MRTTSLVVMAQNSCISGLSNEVKLISEFQVFFKKIAKNLRKFTSKNLGVRKLYFPSVRSRYIHTAMPVRNGTLTN